MSVDNQLTSSQSFSHQNSFLKKVFSLVICKIGCFLCNCCSNSKVFYYNQNPILFFLNFFFEIFNIHISHLTLQSIINMTLKWHNKNISNKIIVFIEFWQLPDVLFVLFDYDCTHMPYPGLVIHTITKTCFLCL